MTVEDLNKEIDHLRVQREEKIAEVNRITGAIDAFSYMKMKLEQASTIPPADSIAAEAA